MQRDNTDQMEVTSIEPGISTLWWPLDMAWRRKDKLREIFIDGTDLWIVYEDVVWPEHPVKGFATLWIVLDGEANVLTDLFYDDREFVRHEDVGPGEASLYALQVPLNHPLLPEPGQEFGLLFAQPTVRSSVKKYTMPGEIVTEPDNVVGEFWPCFADGRAPVLAMAPTGEQSNEIWAHWLDNIHPRLIEMEVDGFHCPMQGQWRPHYYRLLMERNARQGKVTAWWMDEEMGGGPEHAMVQLRKLIELYDAIHNPGWQIVGPTYDVWQASGWESVDVVNAWIGQARTIVGNRHIMVGARARRNPETGQPEQRYVGDYRAYEFHVVDGTVADRVFQVAVQVANGVPVAEFDRFRVRHGGAGKDSIIEDIPLICQASRDRRVAIIIGMADGRGNVSDVGSGLFPNALEIQAILVKNGAPEPPPKPPSPPDPTPGNPPTETIPILDSISLLQHFRVEAIPGEARKSIWNAALHWATETGELTVSITNDTDETFVLWGVGAFIGMEADKQDEITAEPRLRRKDEEAGRLLPAKTEEKDSPGMAFSASGFYKLPVFVRIHPGDEFSGLFQHWNTGTRERQNPETANQPHSHITFYCYREE